MINLFEVPLKYPKRTPRSQMFKTDEERLLFVDWILADVASRPVHGKNPTAPMRGVWIDYDIPHPSGRGKAGIRKGPAYMRLSDVVSRRYVAILALREAGRSLKEACGEVATRLHGATSPLRKDGSIKTGFLKWRSPLKAFWVDAWRVAFDDWLYVVKRNHFDNRVRLIDLANRVQEHAENRRRPRVKTGVYILGERQDSAVFLADKMLKDAERALGDYDKAIEFCERWVGLSARAVMLLARREGVFCQ
jgi:hypothetical protein